MHMLRLLTVRLLMRSKPYLRKENSNTPQLKPVIHLLKKTYVVDAVEASIDVRNQETSYIGHVLVMIAEKATVA